MKKINLNDVDVRSILEMHQKEGYKSSLLNEQYNPIYDQNMRQFRQVDDQQTQKKSTNVVGKESYTIMSDKYTLASYTKGDNKDGLNLFKGVKFVKSKNGNYLVTQSTLVQLSQRNTGDDKGTANAVVMYNCSTAQFTLGQVKNDKGADSFYLKEKGRSWFDESKTLTNQLKSVCQYKGGSQTNAGQTSNTETKKVYTTPKGGFTAKPCQVGNQIAVIENTKFTYSEKYNLLTFSSYAGKDNAYFNCTNKTFNLNDKTTYGCKNDQIANILVKDYCKTTTNKTKEPNVGGGGTKPKTFKLNPTEEQQCQLLGDKVWSYAKKGNQWFASKDKTNWFDITNNKAAVDKLVAGCKNIKELVAFTPPTAAEYEGPSPDEMKASQDGETLVSSTTGL